MPVTKNRTIRALAVKTIRRDIVENRYPLTGETVIFDRETNLLDGQHRLKACIASELAIVSAVFVGVEQDVQRQIDTGTKRNGKDTLLIGKIADKGVATHLAGACAWLEKYRRDEYAAQDITNARISQVASAHPDLENSIHWARNGKVANWGLAIPVAAGVHYLTMRATPERSREFFDRLTADEEHRDPLDPANMLYWKLQKKREARRALTQPEVSECLIKAWNAYFTGDPIERIYVTGRVIPRLAGVKDPVII